MSRQAIKQAASMGHRGAEPRHTFRNSGGDLGP